MEHVPHPDLVRFAQAHLRYQESLQTALERLSRSPYVLEQDYQPEGHFYRVERIADTVTVVYVNRAHLFWEQLWDASSAFSDWDSPASEDPRQTALGLFLFSLAQVEVQMSQQGHVDVLHDVRSRWSPMLQTFLSVLR